MLIKDYKPSTAANATGYFTRAGYDLLPYPLAYFPDSINRLTVYYEAYRLDKATTDSAVYFQCSIQNTDGDALTDYVANDEQHTDSLNVFFASMDIGRLKSGRYYLNLAALDRNKNRLGETGFYFARAVHDKDGYDNLSSVNVGETFAANINRDSLWMWLGGLDNLGNGEEQKLIRSVAKSKDSLQAKRFIYVFMQHRQPDDPEDAWLSYRRTFAEVEYNFATPVRHGYETDRGRVYMRYGRPDQRNVSTSEPGAYPYEVWQYYRLPNGQTDVYFVFYLPGLATNDYKLIHSNARGEASDPHWKQKIYPMNPSADPDKTNIEDHYGQRIDTYIPH